MGRLFIKSSIYLISALIVGSCAGTKDSGRKLRKAHTELDRSAYSEYQYALTEATKQKLFGNLKEAATLYQKCIEFNPGSATAYYQLGNIYSMIQDWKSAVQLYQRAISTKPDNYWFYARLAHVYNVQEKYDSAMIIYEQITEQWPEKVEVRYELARLNGLQGNERKALVILENIEKEKGISEAVSLLKHQLWLNRGNAEKAVAELKKLVEAEPTGIRYRGMLAELYGTIGNNEEALKQYREILKIDPSNGLAFLSIAEFYKQLGEKDKWLQWTGRAISNSQLKVDQKIGTLLPFLSDKKLLMENRNYVDSLCHIIVGDHPGSIRAKNLLADYYVNVKNLAAADSLYEIVLEKEKRKYNIWEQSLYIKNILGLFDELIGQAKEAQKYFGEKPILYFLSGIAHLQLEEPEEALKEMEKAEKYLSEENMALKEQLFNIMGDAYYGTGNADKAFEYYEKTLDINPQNLIVLNNYSYFLAEEETQLTRALEMIKKVIEAEGENPTYLDTYAWVLYKNGRYQEALKYIEEALLLLTNGDPEIYEHYGDILLKNDMNEEALEYWEKALEMNGENKGLEKKIEEYREEGKK